MKYAVVTGVVLGLAGTAAADPKMKELADVLKHPAAGPGLETAHAGPGAWCSVVKKEDSPYDAGRARRTYQEFLEHGYWSAILKTAEYQCNGDPKDATVAALNGELVQDWINLTGESERDANASITMRLQPDKMRAEKEKLCKALAIDDETLGEDRIVATARRGLFGCGRNSDAFEGLWSDGDLHDVNVLAVLDQASKEPDELVRLAYVLDRARRQEIGVDNFPLWGVDAIDQHLLSDDKVGKALGEPPFAGNQYAYVLGKESLGSAHLFTREAEAKAGEKLKDKDWKELLVDAPKRGADAYNAEASKFSAELAKSNEFERKLFGPSKKAVAGCVPELRKDLLKVWRTLPHKTAQEAKDSLSDPIASLLFARYVACEAVDGDPMYAEYINQKLLAAARAGRGQRTAAYYAVLEALGKIVADRERFPVKAESLHGIRPDDELHGVASDHASKRKEKWHDRMGYAGDGGKGVVKSAAKSGDGVLVSFVTSKHQEMGRDCKDTNRIHSIDSSGRLRYYQSCHDTGLFWVNDTPAPVVIPAELAEGIKAGDFMEFDATRGHEPKDRWGIPIAVYADKGKTKLVNWYGFGF